MSQRPRAAVLVFPGTQGDRDLVEALDLAGFAPTFHSAQSALPDGVKLVALPGGFSYGDTFRAGVLAKSDPAVRQLPAFRDAGGLVLGICNGFQILAEARLLPGALGHNRPPGFVHRSVDVRVTQAACRSPFFHGFSGGETLTLPIAHAQGRWVHAPLQDALSDAQLLSERIPLVYLHNPTDSLHDAAAVLDATGRVLGMMPHPERACDSPLLGTDGLRLLVATRHAIQASSSHSVSFVSPQAPSPPSSAAVLGPPAAGSSSPVPLATAFPDAAAAAQAAQQSGLSESEFAHLCAQLGRLPTPTELALFAGMWSEHCSYKSTRHLIAELPTTAPWLLAGPGEHAGAVALTEDWAVAFKIESHNHPSAVEPYQGAATGVGGILRDILALGARPCALWPSLAFGAHPAQHALIAGVYAGISGYGNTVGVPVVGQTLAFHPAYERNPLVNVLAVGTLHRNTMPLRTSRVPIPGAKVLLVGARTGRDGLHGAAFASTALVAGQAQSRLRVQVADPLMGCRLLDAVLAFDATRGLLGGQDLGACGLGCAASELSQKSGLGMQIDLTAVPLREPDLSALEILLSESQERFLFLIAGDAEATALRHFSIYGVPAAILGQLTLAPALRVSFAGQTWVDVPADLVAGGAPRPPWATLRVPLECSRATDAGSAVEPAGLATAPDCAAYLLSLLAHPAHRDPMPLAQQFDATVGNRTLCTGFLHHAAILRLAPGLDDSLAITVAGHGSACALDPYRGAQLAVATAVRRLACVGAKTLAISDGINAPSPRPVQAYYQLTQLLAGISSALAALGDARSIPICSGNMSLYNESPHSAIPPTPMIAALGRRTSLLPLPFLPGLPGDRLVLLCPQAPTSPPAVRLPDGTLRPADTSSVPPDIDLSAERRLVDLLLSVQPLFSHAISVEEGGIALALAQLVLRSGVGAQIELSAVAAHSPTHTLSACLFAQRTAQVIVATSPAQQPLLIAQAQAHGVACLDLGYRGGSSLRMLHRGHPWLDLSCAVLQHATRA